MTKFARTNGPINSIDAAVAYEPVRNTRKTIVANYLLDHIGEWIDAETFNEIGGRAGDRRMRELRQDGWQIETRLSPSQFRAYQHRLIKVPAKKVQALYRKPVKA